MKLPDTLELPGVTTLDLDFTVVETQEPEPHDTTLWVKLEWANPENLMFCGGPFLQRLTLLKDQGHILDYRAPQAHTRTVVSPGHFARYRNTDHYATAWCQIERRVI